MLRIIMSGFSVMALGVWVAFRLQSDVALALASKSDFHFEFLGEAKRRSHKKIRRERRARSLTPQRRQDFLLFGD